MCQIVHSMSLGYKNAYSHWTQSAPYRTWLFRFCFCAIEYLVTRSQRQKIQAFLSFLFGVTMTKREQPDMFEENAVSAVEEEEKE
jgi:hypothetical protein